MLINATCVVIEKKGLLIAGPAGAGKSDLALRLMDQGARLVADDQTELKIEKDELIASAPASIKGLFEVRHVGLVRMPYVNAASIALYIELTLLHEKLERLPEYEDMFLLDHPVRRLRLPAFAASTPAKICAALGYPLATESK
jgi:serine kinase of HPr protein (carbohydrate metabolism regulator)